MTNPSLDAVSGARGAQTVHRAFKLAEQPDLALLAGLDLHTGLTQSHDGSSR